jgi:hypothetical protein
MYYYPKMKDKKIQIVDTYVHVHDNLHTDEYQHPLSECKAIRTR